MDREPERPATWTSRRRFLGERRSAGRRDLDTAERRYRSLVERGPLALYEWEFGSPGRWRYVSPQVEELIGYPPEELLADPELWFRLIHDDDRGAVLEEEARSQATAAGERVEYRMRHRDGRLIWVRDDAVAVTDEGPPFFRGVLSDITAQKLAEAETDSINAELERRVEERTTELRRKNAELVEARDHALRASRVQSEFLSRASHELRTPLNAILGFGQLLQNADLGAFERDAVDHIVVGGRRLLELVNDVLDISAVRSGRISLSIEPVAVPEVVGEAIRDVRAQASDDGIDVEVRAGRNPTFVLADQQRLRQALSGIVSHAVTFQRVGGLLSIAWDTGPGPTTTITVTDTGAGIDPTQVDHLFAALGERATTSGETKAQLQLPLAKALIEAMGGSISVETDPGRGSVVSVTLRTAEDPRRLLDNLSGTGIDGRAVSILYIDDNLTNLDLVQQILAHRPGTTLLRAVLAEVGIQLAEEHRPDLVLLDLHLPDLTGEEALAKLRSTEKTKDVPVVVLSSEQRQRPSKALRQLGIAGYLSKPLDVGQFLATVDRALAARGRGGA